MLRVEQRVLLPLPIEDCDRRGYGIEIFNRQKWIAERPI